MAHNSGYSVIRINTSYAQILTDLGRRLFFETFAAHNTPENMDAYLDESYNLEIQTKELEDPANDIYMAFNENQDPIGFCQLRQREKVYDFIDDKDAVELQRIYVDKNYAGKGIGKILFDKTMARSKELGKKTVWLGVWEHNVVALKFYERQGFYKVGMHQFVMGDQVDNDLVMVKKLE
jgi:ribosomal protein S18 acetylase RimI-like enzyme